MAVVKTLIGNVKGTPGAQGPLGPTGPQGVTGVQGPTGARGPGVSMSYNASTNTLTLTNN